MTEAPRRSRIFGSLRARVVAWNILLLAVMLGALGATMPFLVRSAMLASVDRDLLDRARRFLAHPPPGSGIPPPADPRDGGPGGPDGPDGPGRPGPPPDMGPNGPPPGGPPDERPLAGGQGGSLRPRVIFSSRPPGDSGPSPWDAHTLAAAAQREYVYSNATFEGEPLRIISVRFPPTGPAMGVLQMPYALGEVNRAVSGLTTTLLLLAPIALLIAGAGGFLLTGRALRPVQEITRAAERIGGDALHERLPVHGEDEFTRLADTFNAMLSRLEESFGTKEALIARLSELIEQQRRFTADASHELRTPLTAIKANASLSLTGAADPFELRQAMQEIDTSATAMARLVDDLLILARSDAGQLVRNPIELPLSEPVRQAIARTVHAGRAPITLQTVDEGVTVSGCEEELTRLFANLLENASRHTPCDGSITVSVREDGASALVEVADTGSGISGEHLAHLGERFYRVDEARARIHGGNGLGLSICKSIVEAHGGTLEFRSAPGHGTTVAVRLPRSNGCMPPGTTTS